MAEIRYGGFLIHVNNNHYPAGSKKGGQFAPGDGDGDGIENDHAHRSKKFIDDMNAGKGVVLKKDYDEFKSKTGSYERMKKAADTGILAMRKTGDNDPELVDYDDNIRNWFIFEDQTTGYAEIADLANQGFTKDEIKNIIKTAYDLELKNDDFFDDYVLKNRPKDRTGPVTVKDIISVPEVWDKKPYKNMYGLYSFYDVGIDDKYIEACVEAAKELEHSDDSNYLIHVNNNHYPAGSKKGGQFAPGDGDGDGTADDHAHRKSDFVRKAEKSRDLKKGLATAGFIIGAAGLAVAGYEFVYAIGVGDMLYADIGGAVLLTSVITLGTAFENANSAKSVDKLLNDPAKVAMIESFK